MFIMLDEGLFGSGRFMVWSAPGGFARLTPQEEPWAVFKKVVPEGEATRKRKQQAEQILTWRRTSASSRGVVHGTGRARSTTTDYHLIREQEGRRSVVKADQ
jgi:hypothetical protein